MGKKILRLGETGKGQACKLGGNLMIALMYQGLAEAPTLTAKLGVDRERMFEFISNTMVKSGVSEYKTPFILKHDFTPNFPLRLMHKDIRLMLDAAREHRVKLPGLETVEEIYEIATEEGHADQDYAVTLSILEKWAGIEAKAVTST